MVLIRDCGVRPPRGRVTSVPWQAVVTVLPFVSEHAPRWLSQAHLVGVQRISPVEIEVLRDTLGIPGEHLQHLQTLHDGATLWCTRKHHKFVMTEPARPRQAYSARPAVWTDTSSSPGAGCERWNRPCLWGCCLRSMGAFRPP